MIVKTTVHWLENHEPGRNAFYQVFEMKPETGVPVTVTHWGKLGPTVGEFNRPILGGETQVFRGAIGSSKVAAKLKRKYTRKNTKNQEILDVELYALFGAAVEHSIKVLMFPFDEHEQPTDAPDNEVNPSAIALPEDRPATWGTW